MYANLYSPKPESVYQGLTRWAAHAPVHLLGVIFAANALGAVGVMLIDRERWPVAIGMMALAALGAWGLLEHRVATRHRPSVVALEWVLTVIGFVAALIAGFVAVLWFLGPAPHF